MLVFTPQTPYGTLGAVLSALIVVFCLIGLTLHNDFYAGVRRKDYWVYYTNLSNLLVFLYFALISPLLYAKQALRPLIPHAEFALMMSIMLTHAVFHFMIFPRFRWQAEHAPHTREYDIVRADSLIQHYIVPWLTLAYWLLCSPKKDSLGLADALLWTGAPILYVIFIFIRALTGRRIHKTDSVYPYPFLNIARFGCRCVARTCIALFLLCAGVGVAGVLLTNAAFALFGDTHALILI